MKNNIFGEKVYSISDLISKSSEAWDAINNKDNKVETTFISSEDDFFAGNGEEEDDKMNCVFFN